MKIWGLTEQEKALLAMRKLYGKRSFTEGHIGFRMVGLVRYDEFRKGWAPLTAIGASWEEALEIFKRRFEFAKI